MAWGQKNPNNTPEFEEMHRQWQAAGEPESFKQFLIDGGWKYVDGRWEHPNGTPAVTPRGE